jgi:hypothetical protein
MPTQKFGNLLNAMPVDRRQKIAKRVRETLASMPLEELRRARQMTQVWRPRRIARQFPVTPLYRAAQSGPHQNAIGYLH